MLTPPRRFRADYSLFAVHYIKKVVYCQAQQKDLRNISYMKPISAKSKDNREKRDRNSAAFSTLFT